MRGDWRLVSARAKRAAQPGAVADRMEPRPAVVGARGALICPCAAARCRPRVRPPRRGGFYGAGSAGAGTVPATLSGVAERPGVGCNSELGFALCRENREAELAA
jgi:hypothetical protein